MKNKSKILYYLLLLLGGAFAIFCRMTGYSTYVTPIVIIIGVILLIVTSTKKG